MTSDSATAEKTIPFENHAQISFVNDQSPSNGEPATNSEIETDVNEESSQAALDQENAVKEVENNAIDSAGQEDREPTTDNLETDFEALDQEQRNNASITELNTTPIEVERTEISSEEPEFDSQLLAKVDSTEAHNAEGSGVSTPQDDPQIELHTNEESTSSLADDKVGNTEVKTIQVASNHTPGDQDVKEDTDTLSPLSETENGASVAFESETNEDIIDEVTESSEDLLESNANKCDEDQPQSHSNDALDPTEAVNDTNSEAFPPAGNQKEDKSSDLDEPSFQSEGCKEESEEVLSIAQAETNENTEDIPKEVVEDMPAHEKVLSPVVFENEAVTAGSSINTIFVSTRKGHLFSLSQILKYLQTYYIYLGAC